MNKADLEVENPRRLRMAAHNFNRGLMGHYFSRPLTKDEEDRLHKMIERHGSCIFLDDALLDADSAAIGAWLCTCEECEIPLVAFVAEARISLFAHQAGEKNFVLKDENTVEIQTQTIGTAEKERALQLVSIATKVAADVATKISTRVAALTLLLPPSK